MAAIWRVTVNLGPLAVALQQAHAEIKVAVHEAVGVIAQNAYVAWRDKVLKAPLWSVERDAYADSIAWRYTGDYAAEVWTDYKLADPIETGRPAHDLKAMLDTSLKVRLSKKGRRYLIIPFRHNMTELQKAGVYVEAKKLTATTISGSGWRPSGTGALDLKTQQPFLVPKLDYAWGAAMGSTQSNLNRLYRFNTSAGKSKSSAYLTFRTMVEGSPGWIVAAQPGLYLAKEVADQVQEEAPKLLAAALGS